MNYHHDSTVDSSTPARTTQTAWHLVARRAAQLLAEAQQTRRTRYLAGITTELLSALQAAGVSLGETPPAIKGLSEREFQVIFLVSQGKSNAEIGRELFVSEDTIKTHTRRIYRKLDARDRAHAVAIALRARLLR